MRNAKAHIAHLKETGSPEDLTVNGRAEIVVLDAASYQRMQERLERAELVLLCVAPQPKWMRAREYHWKLWR